MNLKYKGVYVQSIKSFCSIPSHTTITYLPLELRMYTKYVYTLRLCTLNTWVNNEPRIAIIAVALIVERE